jgi:hypothetical protein
VTTATATRFYAARLDGRYRVIDSATDTRVATVASRARAEERARQLNAEEPWGIPPVPPMHIDETALTACGKNADGSNRTSAQRAADKAARWQQTRDAAELAVLQAAAAALDALPTDDEPVGAPAEVETPAPVEVITETGGELRQTEHGAHYLTAAEAATTPAVERIPLGTIRERKPAKAKTPKAAKEAPPAPTGQIGRGVVRFTLTTEEAGTVAYTSGSQINRDYAKAVAEGRPAVLRTIKGHIIRQNQPTA